MLPTGQRCTQQLRHYFTHAIGPAFTFDAAVRDFITHGAGQTLEAATAHWHTTRSNPAPEIGSQFELNTFLRNWHQQHPHKSHIQALDAWRTHRQLPVESRQPL